MRIRLHGFHVGEAELLARLLQSLVVCHRVVWIQAAIDHALRSRHFLQLVNLFQLLLFAHLLELEVRLGFFLTLNRDRPLLALLLPLTLALSCQCGLELDARPQLRRAVYLVLILLSKLCERPLQLLELGAAKLPQLLSTID